jgi:hypothetical protein
MNAMMRLICRNDTIQQNQGFQPHHDSHQPFTTRIR